MSLPLKQLRRSPDGVVSDKPINVRFLSGERQKFAQLADRESRSVASAVRLMALRGLADYERELRGPPSKARA